MIPIQKKVLVTLPVLFTGGTEVQTLHLVRALVGDGYKVTICCYYEFDASVAEWFRKAGAEISLIGMKRKAGLTALFFRLWRLFRDQRPDVVHVQYLAPGLIPVLAARAARISTIFATVHQPGRTYGRREKLFLRLAAALTNRFFCVSQAVERSWFGHVTSVPWLVGRRGEHCTLYNAVDFKGVAAAVATADVFKLKETLGIARHRVVGVVGRLRREKGHHVLLEALPIIAERIPQIVLLVVGDGPDRGELLELADRLGVAERVRWLGEVTPTEVWQLYAIMEVVAVPSLFEGFGLVAAEAMAAGRTVVASDVDGLAEIVEGDVTGILVPPGDPTALAEGISALLKDDATIREMEIRGRAKAEVFSFEQFRSSVLQIYKENPA